jgi:hypothetical protein
MINAKNELLQILESIDANVQCAIASFGSEHQICLQVGYDELEWDEFLQALDRDYDNGCSEQVLFGTIWLDDRSWLERYSTFGNPNFDGSEWWELRDRPKIPSQLRRSFFKA